LNVSAVGLAVSELAPPPAAFTVRVTRVVCVKLPEIPVTVNPTVMLAAVLLADSVRVLVPVVLGGLKTAVTPLGKPGTDKPTLLLNPFIGAMVIVLVPLAPCAIVTLLGEAEMPKSGFDTVAAFTVTLSLAVCVKAPEVPVRVTAAVPVAAALVAVNVSVLLPVTLLGLNVTPLGRPEAERPMVPVKLFVGLTVRLLVPVDPATTVALVAEMLKSGFDTVAAFTVTLNVAVCVKAPEVPVRVTAAVPVVAPLVAVNVSVLLPVTLLGLNVTPLGRPEAERLMGPVKLFVGLTVRLLVPVAPCTTVALVAERVKSGFGAAAGVSMNVLFVERSACGNEPASALRKNVTGPEPEAVVGGIQLTLKVSV
jgi:hypothetical protein